MKYLLFILIVFASCKQKKTDPQRRVPVVDSFGLSEFNQTTRFLPQEELDQLQQVARGPKPKPPRPGSIKQAVLFIDFDGGMVSGTSWNFYGPFYCENSGLTILEQQTVFDSLVSKYKIFPQVLITRDSNVYNAAVIKQQLMVTQTDDWYPGAGGVAFIGTLFETQKNPAFIFSKALGYNVKFILEAAPHEFGHTFGLLHQSLYDSDGNKTQEYDYGSNGNGWIMGVSYYQAMSRWKAGKNSAYQDQNDSVFIRQKLQLAGIK